MYKIKQNNNPMMMQVMVKLYPDKYHERKSQ